MRLSRIYSGLGLRPAISCQISGPVLWVGAFCIFAPKIRRYALPGYHCEHVSFRIMGIIHLRHLRVGALLTGGFVILGWYRFDIYRRCISGPHLHHGWKLGSGLREFQFLRMFLYLGYLHLRPLLYDCVLTPHPSPWYCPRSRLFVYTSVVDHMLFKAGDVLGSFGEVWGNEPPYFGLVVHLPNVGGDSLFFGKFPHAVSTFPPRFIISIARIFGFGYYRLLPLYTF